MTNILQRIFWSKSSPATSTANVPQSLWIGAGNPSAGQSPSLGLAGAEATDMNTEGALRLHAGDFKTIIGMECNPTANVNGTLILCDRLAHARITNDQATGDFVPRINASERLQAGEGGMILVTVASTLSAASNTRTFTYTNQNGNLSQTTPSFDSVASAVLGSVPIDDTLWLPLAAGDTGVRSIEATTLSAGSATGELDVAIVKPLAKIHVVADQPTKRDFAWHITTLPTLRRDSCLMFVWLGSSITTSDTFSGALLIP